MYPTDTAQPSFHPNSTPVQAPPKKSGGLFLVVLSLLLAGGLAWGGLVASRQIREKRSKEFLLQAVQQHVQEQRPLVEKIGSIESFTFNDEVSAMNAASGAIVFDVSGTRGQGRVLGIQRPNGLEFQLKMAAGETVDLEPLVVSQ